MFDRVAPIPAVQSLARRVEKGGALSCSEVAAPARPFFAALLQKLFPRRLIVIVTDNLKTQESFQQDLETWLPQLPTPNSQPLFFPAWEILPHEGKLPHADIISDRLQTLVALADDSSARPPGTRRRMAPPLDRDDPIRASAYQSV